MFSLPFSRCISHVPQNNSRMDLLLFNEQTGAVGTCYHCLKRELAAQPCATNLATLSISSFNLHQCPTATNKSWTQSSALRLALPASGPSSTLLHHGQQHVQTYDKKAGAKSWVNWPDLDQADYGEYVQKSASISVTFEPKVIMKYGLWI
jgi:hypothetical protein